MKKLLLPRIPLFSTKKRSSNLFWTNLAFLTIAVVFMGVLTVDDMSRARIRNAKFFNVQAVNYSFLRSSQIENEAFLKSKSPLFIFEGERVLIGPAAELVSPRPASPIIMTSFSSWVEEFSRQLAKGKLSASFYDAQLVGVALNRAMTLGERAALLAQVRYAISGLQQAAGLAPASKIPSLVFVQLQVGPQ